MTTQTQIKDTGILKLDGGRTHVDDADHKAMGWMTFEDVDRLLAQRRRGEGRAGARQDAPRAVVGDPPLDVARGSGFGAEDRDRRRRRGRRPRPRPDDHGQWRQIDLANGAFGQGVAVTPIQLATAYAAMVNGGTLVQPHVVKAVGVNAREIPPTGPGDRRRSLSITLIELMNHVVTEVPFYRDRTLIQGYDVGGKTGTAQIWDPKARGGQGDWKHNIFNYSFVGYIGRDDRASRTSSSRSGSTRARRRSPSSASSRCRSCRSSCSAGSPPTRSRPPGPPAGPDGRAAARDGRRRRHDPEHDRDPVSAACATLDRVTDRRDPSPAADGRRRRSGADRRGPRRGHRGAPPRPFRPADPRRRRRLPRGPCPGNLFVALPGERTDGHRFVGAAPRRGRGGVRRRPAARRRRSSTTSTRRSSPSPTRCRALQRRRGRLAPPLRPARRRRHRLDREDLDEGGDRDGPRRRRCRR